jgi:hypothetical protein
MFAVSLGFPGELRSMPAGSYKNTVYRTDNAAVNNFVPQVPRKL